MPPSPHMTRFTRSSDYNSRGFFDPGSDYFENYQDKITITGTKAAGKKNRSLIVEYFKIGISQLINRDFQLENKPKCKRYKPANVYTYQIYNGGKKGKATIPYLVMDDNDVILNWLPKFQKAALKAKWIESMRKDILVHLVTPTFHDLIKGCADSNEILNALLGHAVPKEEKIDTAKKLYKTKQEDFYYIKDYTDEIERLCRKLWISRSNGFGPEDQFFLEHIKMGLSYDNLDVSRSK